MRVALFIDGSNIFYTEKTLGWEIDFIKVYDYFDQHFTIYNAFYYAAEPQDDEEVRKKYQRYSLKGYTMRLKKLKEIRDFKGDVVAKKANLDVEMVIDMFNTKDNYDLAVLFTGDSDFVRLVDLLRTYGKQIFVFSTKGHSSAELINVADKFFDFQEMKKTFTGSASPAEAAEKKPGSWERGNKSPRSFRHPSVRINPKPQERRAPPRIEKHP